MKIKSYGQYRDKVSLADVMEAIKGKRLLQPYVYTFPPCPTFPITIL